VTPRLTLVELFGLLVLLLMFVTGVSLFAGCATGATTARKAVTATYTAIGAASAIARPALKKCEDDAVAKKDAAALMHCAEARNALAKALPALEQACNATAAAIDAGEAIKAKDYSSALAPLYGAAVELAQALTTLGVRLPVQIPGVN
jgi:hypothetical protein